MDLTLTTCGQVDAASAAGSTFSLANRSEIYVAGASLLIDNSARTILQLVPGRT